MDVEQMSKSAAGQTWRMVVRLDRWEDKVETIVRMKHDWSEPFSVTDMAQVILVSQSLEPAADATLLVFQVQEPTKGASAWFGFNAHGRKLQLDTLSCRQVAPKPPSAPPWNLAMGSKMKASSIGAPKFNSMATRTVQDPTDQDRIIRFSVIALGLVALFMFKDVVVQQLRSCMAPISTTTWPPLGRHCGREKVPTEEEDREMSPVPPNAGPANANGKAVGNKSKARAASGAKVTSKAPPKKAAPESTKPGVASRV